MAHQCVVVLVMMKERYFDDLKAGDRFKFTVECDGKGGHRVRPQV